MFDSSIYFICLFFVFLGLPLFAVRCIALLPRLPKTEMSKNVLGKSLVFLMGVSQDFLVLSEFLLLFLILRFFIPLPFVWKLSIFGVATFCLHFNVIVDGLLYRQTSIRLEASFLSFFDDIRCFWDSLKERGFRMVIPLGMVLIGLNILAFSFFVEPLKEVSLSTGLLSFLILFSLPGIVGELFLPNKVLYGSSNIAIQQQIWFFNKLFSFLTRKRKLASINRETLRKIFSLKKEKATYISKTYPLLKYTYGFEGEKAFDIDIKEGEKPHVIFLFMESFRAKNVGCISGEEGVTPHFDALAKEGILFTDFYSNSIKTSRAVTASLFGVPSDVDSSNTSNRIDLPLIGVSDVLKQHGYNTAYLHNGMLKFENQFEFFKSHGFETILGKEDILKQYPAAPSTSWGVHDEYLMRFTNDWLNANALDTPFFTTMFTITNHHPWSLPPGYGSAMPKLSKKTAYQRYLQTFRYSDYALGLFIRKLKESGLSKKTIVFILGDHGQPMGEHHQNFSNQKGLYEENVHIPLLILADGKIADPKVISTPGSQVDLMPTLIDLLGIRGFNHAVGHSLLRENPEKQVFFHNPYVYGFFGCRKESLKFIYLDSTDEVELYDLDSDPLEQNNIAEKHPDLVRGFLKQVMDYQKVFKKVYQNRLLVDPKKELFAKFKEKFIT